MSTPKYNISDVERDGVLYKFVTRGRAKKFSQEEIKEFFSINAENENNYIVPIHLKRIFAMDLRRGTKFCAQKYGCTEKEVLKNAELLLPGRNLDIYIGDG